jgi:hypothetical protein
MPRLTGPEKAARGRFDALAARSEALQRHIARLRRDLAGETAFGNWHTVELLRHSLDSARNELLAMVPKLQAAMRALEKSRPRYLLPQPARPAIVVTKPRSPVIDLTGRGRSFDAAGRVRPANAWHVRTAAEWRAICKSIEPRRG